MACLCVCVSAISKAQDSARAMVPKVRATTPAPSLPGYESSPRFSQGMGHNLPPSLTGYGPPHHIFQGTGHPVISLRVEATPISPTVGATISCLPGYGPNPHLPQGKGHPIVSPRIQATLHLSQGTGQPVVSLRVQAHPSPLWGTYFLCRLSQG